MGLIRLLIFVLAAWLAWKMFQNYRVKQARQRQERQKALRRELMVKCAYCQVHLPESDAVAHDELWFCNPQHKSRFLTDSR